MLGPVIIMPVHGMGDTRLGFDQALKRTLRRQLGRDAWPRVIWQPVYYQDVLQDNQRQLLQRTRDNADIDWIRLRRFLLFGFSDAAGMEMKPHHRNSIYQQIQARILDALDRAFLAAGDAPAPIVLVAHSLGGQVISNYIWDAQCAKPKVGVFRPDLPNPVGKRSPRDRFRRLKSLASLFTTGCNIPVFIAGLPPDRIRPVIVDKRGWRFRWENYYDADDVLGWPLKPVNVAYRNAIARDRQVNVGMVPGAWTPLSHAEYWSDSDFLGPLESAVRTQLG